MESKTETFVGLVKKYDDALTQFAKSYVKNLEIAQEVVSDTFYVLWERKGGLEDIRNLESYLYISTKNRCLDYLKSKTGQNDIKTDQAVSFDFLIENFDPEQILLSKEKVQVLDRAIEELPHSCKVVFNLVKQQGMRQKQVAEIMNISVKTVENQVAKAVKRLRITLQKYNNDNDDRNSRREALIIIMILFQSIELFLE
ncbi:RNA polymerase sigma-70 factor [Flexithrix dorotheae]|uniref:RNA polymerase sigma-70 factor n=1 Tax=Flexithrix dorotheae TaxID=70993 RepID=UPI0003690915|nr:RNA polymerase sigma-70 factor [Flexithrix dorotheae]